MEYHFARLIIWRSQVQALSGPPKRIAKRFSFYFLITLPITFISTVYESCVKIIRTVEMVKCDKSDKRQNDKSPFLDSGF